MRVLTCPVSLGGLNRAVISNESFIKHLKESPDQPCVKVLTFGEPCTITKRCSTREPATPLRAVNSPLGRFDGNGLRFPPLLISTPSLTGYQVYSSKVIEQLQKDVQFHPDDRLPESNKLLTLCAVVSICSINRCLRIHI